MLEVEQVVDGAERVEGDRLVDARVPLQGDVGILVASLL